MTITYEQFAEFLLKHSVYYYRPDRSVHAYIAEDGRVRYFANWGYGETRDYASLKSLYEATADGADDLPDAEDLAEVVADPLKAFRWAHEAETRHETEAESDSANVTVSRRHLRVVLDYLHDSEADHYEETVADAPEHVNTHVYAHVLAIEAQMTDAEADTGGAPATSNRSVSNDVLCELAHNVTVRECRIRGLALDPDDATDDETHYTDEAQEVFDAVFNIASTVLEPYCEKGGAQ